MRAENDKIVIQMSHLYLSINCSFFVDRVMQELRYARENLDAPSFDPH